MNIAPIIVIPIVLFAAMILFLFIINDIKSAQKYEHACRCTGSVVKQLENTKIYRYGSGLHKYTRTYQQYEVEYQVDGNTYRMVLQTKKKGLAAGDPVEVRYILRKDTHEPEGVTSVYADRLKELAAGAIIGFIFALGIMLFTVARK